MTYIFKDVTSSKVNNLSEYSEEIQSAYKHHNRSSNSITMSEDKNTKLWLVCKDSKDNFAGFISARISQLLPKTKNVSYVVDVSNVAMLELAAPLLEKYITNNYDTPRIVTSSLPGVILEQDGYTRFGGSNYSKPINGSVNTDLKKAV